SSLDVRKNPRANTLSSRVEYRVLWSELLASVCSNHDGCVLRRPKKGVYMFGKLKSLRELFEIELGYAYDCEKRLVEKGLQSMIENAASSELRSALEQHLKETRTHVTRLERVFSVIGIEPRTESNAVLDELTSAAKDSISHTEDSLLRD